MERIDRLYTHGYVKSPLDNMHPSPGEVIKRKKYLAMAELCQSITCMEITATDYATRLYPRSKDPLVTK